VVIAKEKRNNSGVSHKVMESGLISSLPSMKG